MPLRNLEITVCTIVAHFTLVHMALESRYEIFLSSVFVPKNLDDLYIVRSRIVHFMTHEVYLTFQ